MISSPVASDLYSVGTIALLSRTWPPMKEPTFRRCDRPIEYFSTKIESRNKPCERWAMSSLFGGRRGTGKWWKIQTFTALVLNKIFSEIVFDKGLVVAPALRYYPPLFPQVERRTKYLSLLDFYSLRARIIG